MNLRHWKIFALQAILLLALTEGNAYNIKTITSREGLTNSAILSFGQINDGIMFFGTCDGVNCYDGTRVFPLIPINGKKIKGNIIENIVVDKSGRSWVLTNHGLASIQRMQEPRNWPLFRAARGIRLNADGNVTLLQDGSLYIGQDTTFVRIRLNRIDQTERVIDFAMAKNYFYLFKNDGIVRYAIRRDGNKYSLGQRTELSREQLRIANNDENGEMLLDSDGQLWSFDLITGNRQPIINLQSEMRERGTIGSIRSMGNRLFVCFTASGVLVFEHQGDNYKKYDLGITVGALSSFKSPNDDIMWIGTDGHGVLMFVDETETRRSLTAATLGLEQNKPYRAIYKDAAGTLWAGTKGNGLLEISHFNLNDIPKNQERRFHRAENSGLAGNAVFALQPSKILNGFWIATSGGLSFRAPKSGKIVTVPTELPLQWISAVCERGDTLWLATQGMGVYRGIISGTAESPRLVNMHRYTIEGGEKAYNYFFSMGSANKKGGKLYFGNRGMGLYTMQEEILKWIKLDAGTDDDIGLQDIFAILPTAKGVWVGSACGLIYKNFANDKTEIYSTANGMPSDVIHALVEDGSGNVWASTNKGLVRFWHGTHAMRVYSETDNMEVNEYADGAAFAVGDTVFFGGVNGISIIVSGSTQTSQKMKQRLEFTGLTILGEPANIYDFMSFDEDRHTLTLDYTQNTFTLHLSNFDFKAPNNYNFYYSFSDDGSWISNGNSKEINLTRLTPGRHTLYVKCQNRLTGEEMPVYVFYIRITPPWYLSWWAEICYMLIAAGIAYYLYRRWKRHLEKRNHILEARREQDRRDEIYEEKMHFLTNLVHELNTPLTLVYGPCERILNYTNTDNFVRKYIRMIQTNIGRLNYLIKEIIDFRRMATATEELRIKAVYVGQWVEEMYKAFSDLAEENNINYENDIDTDLVWNLDERLLPRICSNLISNAFKYSHPEATVRVSLHRSEDDNQLVFSVYNTGKGIKEIDRQRIFNYYTVLDNVDESSMLGLTSRNGLGMAICHNSVTRLGGKIDIDSVVNEYACFIVKLPWNELPEDATTEPLTPHFSMTASPIAKTGTQEKNNLPPADEQTSVDTYFNNVNIERKSRTPRPHHDGLPTVLIIDDNADILDLLADALGTDYNVLTAESGEQGLEVIKQQMPDLIVTDIMMPSMDGLELTQLLKQNKHTMHIPLVILSARRSETDKVEGLESGADAYVSKPFSIQYMQATVARLLENRKVLKEYFNTSASAFTYQDGKLMTGEERLFCEEVTAIIKKNIKNADFTPEDLARELAVSQRNLYRKFNEAGLPTPKEYIKQFKIKYAAKLIDTTSLTIQEIIYSSGFNTRSQFYTEFRKHYGVTPKEYREEHRVRDVSLENENT